MYCLESYPNNCELCYYIINNKTVLKQTSNFTILLNAYPYGAITIVTNSHIDCNLLLLPQILKNELIFLISKSQEILNNLGCNSFNISINTGPLNPISQNSHFYTTIIPYSPNVQNNGLINSDTFLHYQYIKLYENIRNIFRYTIF